MYLKWGIPTIKTMKKQSTISGRDILKGSLIALKHIPKVSVFLLFMLCRKAVTLNVPISIGIPDF